MNRATNSLFYTDAMSQVQSTVHVTDQRKREYSEQLQQWGAHAKLDFVPAYGHKIEWYNAYIGSRSDQVREMTITDLSLDYNPELGNYTKTYQTRARRTLQGIFSSTSRVRTSWATTGISIGPAYMVMPPASVRTIPISIWKATFIVI